MRNSSTDREQDYLSDGISEALVNRLSQVPELKVVANSSSSRFKGQDADPQVVAQALNVAGILAGRVSQRGDSLSISIELIDARDRTQVWGEQYVRKTADLSRCRRTSLVMWRGSCGSAQPLARHQVPARARYGTRRRTSCC